MLARSHNGIKRYKISQSRDRQDIGASLFTFQTDNTLMGLVEQPLNKFGRPMEAFNDSLKWDKYIRAYEAEHLVMFEVSPFYLAQELHGTYVTSNDETV